MALLASCTFLFFQPDRVQYLAPEQLQTPFERVSFVASDGVALSGWYLPAQKQPALGSVLFLHGNAQNISSHVVGVHWLPAEGFNVFLPDYRGYGGSEGQPSLAGVQRDIAAALAWLDQKTGGERGQTSEMRARIAMYGQSLGGALAITFTARLSAEQRAPLCALVSEGAFASYPSIAREKLAGVWLTWPLQWLGWLLVDGSYDAEDAIARIAPLPLVIAQGGQDKTVPPHHGLELALGARAAREFWLEPEAGHISMFRRPAWRTRLVNFLKTNCAPPQP